jgi:hypothetical protein
MHFILHLNYVLLFQLRSMASDEMDNKLLQLNAYQKSIKFGKLVAIVYQERVEFLQLYLNDLIHSSMRRKVIINKMNNVNITLPN